MQRPPKRAWPRAHEQGCGDRIQPRGHGPRHRETRRDRDRQQPSLRRRHHEGAERSDPDCRQEISVEPAGVEDGNGNMGWACLKFSMGDPQYYMYHTPSSGTVGATGDNFSCIAQGDLNGDAKLSTFTMKGEIRRGEQRQIGHALPEHRRHRSGGVIRREPGFYVDHSHISAPASLGRPGRFSFNLAADAFIPLSRRNGRRGVARRFGVGGGAAAVRSQSARLAARRAGRRSLRAQRACAGVHAGTRPIQNAFPASVALTPAQVPRGERVSDPPGTWDHPTWRALEFSFTVPHSFSFAFESKNGDMLATFRATAHGDLDADGILSTFEIRGETRPGAQPSATPLEFIEKWNELVEVRRGSGPS